ncbi:MAG: flavin reductase [Provencibacterium sp.]|jgi:flavin reductase (DIM6/NTAB) family NADH-FMN oxidoreductase RutF|nr:flavin reductase [Provencibacterium sp.]
MDGKALEKLSYGLFILTAREGEKDNGCIVNTVSQATVQPNRILVTVDKKNYTHGMIQRTGMFNVSILAEDSVFETYRHWGFQSGEKVDKLEGVSVQRAENGLVYVAEGCNAYLCAKVVSAADLGTHTLFIADVAGGGLLSEKESATYRYYQQHIKPAPKAEEKKKGFVCVVCGYVYEGDTLPDDFICPWCKHPASDFRPL